MANEKNIATDLQSALFGQSPLSIDLYVEVLADYEDELKASLDKDADDALLCMLADDGDVAMMVIDWDGSIYRNENALKKLQAMWRHSFDTNVQTLVPILSTHIPDGYLKLPHLWPGKLLQAGRGDCRSFSVFS